MVLYADDTSIIVTDTDKLNFEKNLNQTFNINTWFNNNKLNLHFDKKKQYLEFWSMKCGNTETRFLVLIMDALSWKKHVNQSSTDYPLLLMHCKMLNI
jgi:hypothetical protein